MDYLKLKKTKMILEKIAKKDGLLTWYNIVRLIDSSPNSEINIPTFYVLEKLTHLGFLELSPPDTGKLQKYPRYKLTEIGRSFLDRR